MAITVAVADQDESCRSARSHRRPHWHVREAGAGAEDCIEWRRTVHLRMQLGFRIGK